MSLTAKYKFSTGPFEDLVSNGPATVEHYDSLAGAGACLADAINNVVFRSHTPQFWKAYIPQVEKLTGTTRNVNPEATAKAKAKAKNPASVADVLEGWNPYFTRVFGASSPEDKQVLTDLAISTALALDIAVAPAQRGDGSSKTLVPYWPKTDAYLALDAEALEERMANLTATIGEYDFEVDGEGKPDRTALAKAIQKFIEIGLMKTLG